jgi:hypothetical protein
LELVGSVGEATKVVIKKGKHAVQRDKIYREQSADIMNKSPRKYDWDQNCADIIDYIAWFKHN